mgnify:CR=1 FL=1
MRPSRRTSRVLAAALGLALAGLAACSSNESPTGPDALAPTAVTTTIAGSTVIRVSFTGRAGDTRYLIQRGVGAAPATFDSVGNVPAVSGTTAYTFEDRGLVANTTYTYRIAAVRNGTQSAFTNALTATTSQGGTGGVVTVSGDITSNRLFSSDTVYRLQGFVHVTNGATLTIQPGTTVQGDFNALGSSLFIMRGARIVAAGTEAAPIVFTSSQPAGSRRPGDWGGLVIIGNGLVNRTGDIEIEGTGTVTGTAPGTNYRVTYSGGTNNVDNSGVLRYVRVEFAGYAPALNQELNSFTFGAVGQNTQLSYLQTLAGLDDSFEWFGGNVDGDRLVSYESGDDHFDMSEGYSGRLQYLIAFQSTVLQQRDGAGQPSADPQGIENDGCNGTGCTNGFNATPLTVPVVANFTLIGTGSTASSGASGGIGMMLRRGTGGYYVNGVVARWPRGGVSVRDAETYTQRAGGAATPDLAIADLAVRNVVFAENSAVFQTGGSNVQNTFDLGGNALVAASGGTASLFTAFPATVNAQTTAAAFDWAPAAGSALASGGLATFTGKLAAATTRALASGNGTVAGTPFVGAAQPGGPKWWAGWTRYAQN